MMSETIKQYKESDINTVIALLNSINYSGIENANRILSIYNILHNLSISPEDND